MRFTVEGITKYLKICFVIRWRQKSDNLEKVVYSKKDHPALMKTHLKNKQKIVTRNYASIPSRK